jgi:hypothetical protein
MEIVDINAAVRCQQVAIAADDIPGIREVIYRETVHSCAEPPTTGMVVNRAGVIPGS